MAVRAGQRIRLPARTNERRAGPDRAGLGPGPRRPGHLAQQGRQATRQHALAGGRIQVGQHHHFPGRLRAGRDVRPPVRSAVLRHPQQQGKPLLARAQGQGARLPGRNRRHSACQRQRQGHRGPFEAPEGVPRGRIRRPAAPLPQHHPQPRPPRPGGRLR